MRVTLVVSHLGHLGHEEQTGYLIEEQADETN